MSFFAGPLVSISLLDGERFDVSIDKATSHGDHIDTLEYIRGSRAKIIEDKP
jgi:hypothetical protein